MASNADGPAAPNTEYAANLQMRGIAADLTTRSRIPGTRVWPTRGTRPGALEPLVRAQWIHELLDPATGVTATGGAAPAFGSPTAGLGRDLAVIGDGLTLRASACLALNVNYDLQFNERTRMHIGYGGVEFRY